MEIDFSAFLNDISSDPTTWPNFDPEVAYRGHDESQNGLAEDDWLGFPIYEADSFPVRETILAKRPNDAVDEPHRTKKRQFEGNPLDSQSPSCRFLSR